jgi:hypothetical protein
MLTVMQIIQVIPTYVCVLTAVITPPLIAVCPCARQILVNMETAAQRRLSGVGSARYGKVSQNFHDII